MDIKDLPKPGINFKATLGPGSLKRKLSSATRYGSLKNLRDNQKAIIDTIKNFTTQRAIRRGGLSRLQQRDAWLKMKAKDKTMTKEDRREIKAVLKHLGRGAIATQNKTVVGLKSRLSVSKKNAKASDYLTPEQIKKNLRNMATDESGLETDYRRANLSVAGEIGEHDITLSKSRRTKGTAGDLNVGTGIKTGFAQNYNNKNLPNSSIPKASLGGSRPIGF